MCVGPDRVSVMGGKCGGLTVAGVEEGCVVGRGCGAVRGKVRVVVVVVGGLLLGAFTPSKLKVSP